jgi:hypothetical protein
VTFLLAQALDNDGPDPCVLGGVVHSATEADMAEWILRIAHITQDGEPVVVGATEFARHEHWIVAEVRTTDTDEADRPAPLIVLYRDDLEVSAVAAAADCYASKIGRNLDRTTFEADARALATIPIRERGARRRVSAHFPQWPRRKNR